MIMNRYVICLILIYILEINSVSIRPEVEDVIGHDPMSPGKVVNSVLYKVINKYDCSVPDVNDEHLIVFGSKAWNFPAQDVNVTLSYPTEKTRVSSDHFDDYVITGFRVHLYIDGTHSYGYITNGGILQESITLSFLTSNVTTLWYQFWLFGVPKNFGIGSVISKYTNIKC